MSQGYVKHFLPKNVTMKNNYVLQSIFFSGIFVIFFSIKYQILVNYDYILEFLLNISFLNTLFRLIYNKQKMQGLIYNGWHISCNIC